MVYCPKGHTEWLDGQAHRMWLMNNGATFHEVVITAATQEEAFTNLGA